MTSFVVTLKPIFGSQLKDHEIWDSIDPLNMGFAPVRKSQVQRCLRGGLRNQTSIRQFEIAKPRPPMTNAVPNG